MTHGVGTACWLAPEVIKHARSSKFSDVYGYGIVLWELATREEVYQGLETTQIIAKVANDNLRPPVPLDCPWKDLMVKCWEEKPTDRLEFNEIVVQLNTISMNLDAEGRLRDSSLGEEGMALLGSVSKASYGAESSLASTAGLSDGYPSQTSTVENPTNDHSTIGGTRESGKSLF
jgi:serine/threonine protein kinase